MASLNTLEARMRVLEARLADVEGGYGETLYRLDRFRVHTTITLGRIMENMGLPAVTEEEVDAVLDTEA